MRDQAPEVARKAAQALPPAARKAATVVQKNVRRAATGMLGLSGERMSKVDTAWLRMDSHSNLMMINGVWTLSPGITWEALCERVQQRLLQYPRFRQRVVEDAAGATWVEDRNFDIAAHVQREKLPHRTGHSMQRALQDRVGELAMQPLDTRRPLWQMHLIEDFVGDDGAKGSALIVRIHHCIADGIALISVTMSLVDGGSEPPSARRGQTRKPPPPRTGSPTHSSSPSPASPSRPWTWRATAPPSRCRCWATRKRPCTTG